MSSVKFRLNVWFVLIITVLLLASGAYNYYKGRQALLGALNHQVDGTLQRLSVNLPNAIWNFDKTQIEQTLSSEMSAHFIRGIILKAGDKELGGQVRGADGNLTSSQTPPAADDVRSTELAYMDNGKANPVGQATVYLSYDEINATLNSALLTKMVQILVLDIILVLALSRILSTNILNPLAEIGNALRDIAQVDVAGHGSGHSDPGNHLGIDSRACRRCTPGAGRSQQRVGHRTAHLLQLAT